MSDGQQLLARARRRGDVPVSAPLLRAGSLFAALACLPFVVEAIWNSAAHHLQQVLQSAALRSTSSGAAQGLIDVSPWPLVARVLWTTLPFIAALAAVALLCGLAQTAGWLGRPQRRCPGHPSWAAATTGLVSVAALLGACVWATAARLELWAEPLARSAAVDLGERLAPLLHELGWACAGIALFLGVIDRVWVSKLWRERNELSSFEQRRERREREMSPQARSAQRQAHREVVG